jgi:hypothetical protein
MYAVVTVRHWMRAVSLARQTIRSVVNVPSCRDTRVM